ncbi:MAG: class I SAM-dependent methyltransferase [Chitinophagales bacterium]|nr:class I SAM-dependent methyltransferase [Chitinophagales bacterium]
MSNFKFYSQYYDLLYKDKDYKAEANYIVSLINKYNSKATKIIELGCGTGNHAEIICPKDYEIIGLERSAEMVDLAKQKNINNFFPQVADITQFKLKEKADVALALFHVISYLSDNKQLINCFKTVHNHLNENGIFIFDIWYTPAVYFQKPETRIKRLANTEIEITRLAQSHIHYQTNVVDVNYEVMIKDKETNISTSIFEKHPMRHFSIPEIELLAAHTGFELVHTEEFLTANEPSENTWGVCFILRKKQINE